MTDVMNGELNFDDLTPIEVPVKYDGKDYVLCEADEEAAAVFRNGSIRGAPVDDGEVVGLPTDLGSQQSLLVSRCLHHTDSSGEKTTQLVDQRVLRKWPSRVIKPIFEKAKEISELGEDDDTMENLLKERGRIDKRILKLKENAAKNEPNDTTDGSPVPVTTESPSP